MEQKYQIGNEYGSIMWDIEKILEDKNKFHIKEYDVRDLAQNNPFHGNKDHIMSTDYMQPLIVVELGESLYKLIDGNHRLQKALNFGVEKIRAYSLSLEEHCKYIIDYDEKVYCEVVMHWQQ